MDNATQRSKEMAQIHERVTQLLREIHQRLDATVAVKESEWVAPVAVPEGIIRERLAELGCQLSRTFRAEETGHWLDDEVLNSPQHMDALHRVQSEHPSLLRELADVQASTNTPLGPTISAAEVRRMFHRFLARLADHELREGELLYRVLSDEIGVVD
jgi:hypothetical protein